MITTITDLTQEQSFFISSLSDYVNENQSSNALADVDIDKLIALSNTQQLSSVIFYQTHIPSLKPAFASAFYYAANRKKLLDGIDQQFQSSHIPYITFKGSEVAQYYQHPYLRTFGDIDLLVRTEDKEKAGSILEKIGFESSEHKSKDHEWVYTKGDFEIELHHRLLYDGDDLNDTKLTKFTDTVWEHTMHSDGCCYHIEPEFHFAFLLLHLRKHFLWAGVGIRLFMDLAVMFRNANLDWDKVSEYISICNIEQFSSACFAFVYRWFGIGSPLYEAELSDEFYLTATKTILSDGVFGDIGRENLINNEVINSTYKRGKFGSSLYILFPPYRQMKEKYPNLCGNDMLGKLLLPFLWLRRIIDSLLKHTAGEGMLLAVKHFSTKNGKKMDYLRLWGL